MRTIYFIIMGLFLIGCEKPINEVQYRATITFDNSVGKVGWEDKTRGFTETLKESKTISIFQEKSEVLKGTAAYIGPVKKQIRVSITLDGDTVVNQVGEGVVNINYVP